ncbi:MAG: cyclic 2,3-diphosphoglycerate synthase [Candidatus Krumholzibacteriia bacterium]
MSKRVLIMGAAGKDFHLFNTLFRGRNHARVEAFTATQIPGIEGRVYPQELAGPEYPGGIPIEPEERLEELIRERAIDEVLFAYSDVSYDHVDERRRCVEATGTAFRTPDPRALMLETRVPVVAVCAVRTGCGKSQTSRHVLEVLRNLGKRVVAVRHPMPYGDLVKQRVQRFASIDDLQAQHCTIEEMEEYEPHIRNQAIVYAGVDYRAIRDAAQREADVVIWDGGNNDTPFFRPKLHITLVDPHRPGHELSYYPGRENLELADVILFNKMDSASRENVEQIEANIQKHNPRAKRVYARSPIHVERVDHIEGKRVVVVEDGPTVTHGGMKFGAGILAARKYGARETVDPRPYLVGSIAETFRTYPDIGTLIPAMGYGERQMRDLEETINRVECDSVIVATPIDLGRVLQLDKPAVRVTYELDDSASQPNLEQLLREIFA